jgi:hypothetical protein
MQASYKGNASLVTMLLVAGADYNVADYEVNLALLLFIFIFFSFFYLSSAFYKCELCLLTYDCTQEGCTALFYAADHGNINTVKVLLDAGASLTQVTTEYNQQVCTIMDYAHENKRTDILALLL